MKIYSSNRIPDNATLIVKEGLDYYLRVSLRVPKQLKSHHGVIKTKNGNYIISFEVRITKYDDLTKTYFQLLRQLQVKARDMKIRHLRNEQFILKQDKQLTLKI